METKIKKNGRKRETKGREVKKIRRKREKIEKIERKKEKIGRKKEGMGKIRKTRILTNGRKRKNSDRARHARTSAA